MEAGSIKTGFPHLTITTHAMPAKCAKGSTNCHKILKIDFQTSSILLEKMTEVYCLSGCMGPMKEQAGPSRFLHCLHHGQESNCVYGQAKAGSSTYIC
jgi:hypothetical protein